MAEKAAHFTTTLDVKPSIFELIAQKSLNDTLYPAFQKLAEFVAYSNPEKLGWLLKYYDESFLVANGLLQYFYLNKYNASFAEHFYNLQRISKDSKFTRSHRHVSLLILVVLPYLSRKLERKVTQFQLDDVDGHLDNSLENKLKRTLYQAHSMFAVGWGGWLILNYLKYMANQTDYPLPILSIMKLKLTYAPNLESESFWTALFAKRLSFKDAIRGVVENSLQSIIEIGAFITQFLNVWNSEHVNYNLNALPIVKPPLDNNVEKFQGKCPICLQTWKIPTALPVSGYVFCFSCILNYLKEYKCCPVTKLPANHLDIMRLYDGEHL